MLSAGVLDGYIYYHIHSAQNVKHLLLFKNLIKGNVLIYVHIFRSWLWNCAAGENSIKSLWLVRILIQGSSVMCHRYTTLGTISTMSNTEYLLNKHWTRNRYTYLLDMCREQERLFAECSVVSRGEARCSHDGLQGSGVETGRCNYKGVATHILWGWYTTSYRRNGISGRRTFKVITEISEYLQYCSNHHNVK